MQTGNPSETWSELNVQRVLVTVVTVQMWMQVGPVAALELEPVSEAVRLHLLGVLLFLGQQEQEQQDQQNQQ